MVLGHGHEKKKKQPVGESGLEGEDDGAHFAYAISEELTIITKNPSDFKNRHDHDSNHFGILAVYQDNDPNRDMSDAEIVKGIATGTAAPGSS